MSGNSPKIFVVDTSVFANEPNAIYAFEENTVVIPSSVIRELEIVTSEPGERGANARSALRKIWYIFSDGRRDFKYPVDSAMDKAVELLQTAGLDVENEQGDSFRERTVCKTIPETGGVVALFSCDSMSMEDGAFQAVRQLNGILVTKNTAQRLEALANKLPAEDYRHDKILDDDQFYSGRSIIYLSGSELAAFNNDGRLPYKAADKQVYFIDDERTERARSEKYHLSENEFLILKNADNPSAGTILARYAKEQLLPLRYWNQRPFDVTPRNVGQKFAIEALMAPVEEAPLVILKGPAGTAKTFLSLACGLEKVYNQAGTEYTRVLVSRPNNSIIDDQVGYLPGGETEKVTPLNRPIFDNVEALMSLKGAHRKDDVEESPTEELLARGALQIQAMTYMRGRSIRNNYIIIDEAQNATPQQLLALVTRPGVGTKIVICGDVDQIDHPYLDKYGNGLTFISEKMRGSSLCWQVTFTEDECERSPLALEAIRRLSGAPVTRRTGKK